MRCNDVRELLAAVALDELDGAEAGGVDQHLKSCPSCSVELQQIRQALGLLPAWGVEAPAEDLVSRTVAALQAEREGEPSWEERYHNFVHWLTHLKVTPLRGALAAAFGFCFFFLLLNTGPAPRPASPASRVALCRQNLDLLARASELFHQERKSVPDRLELLHDEYLPSYPVCPAAGFDTYSESFLVRGEGEPLVLYCSGHHHVDEGLEPNQPRREVGLAERSD